MTALPRRRSLACLALLLGLLALPARAHAGVLVRASPPCDGQPLERPFLPWLDPAHYTLAPDGAFSGGAKGWQRSGARVVAQNEPYRVHGDHATAALDLPEGSSATSPAICVGLEHPTLRFFARNTGSLLGTLQVEVRFEDALGKVHSLPIGVVAGTGGWHPTLPFPVLANLLPLLPGQHTPVAFRFTPVGLNSSWQIDDVYVDPYGKG
jgi:hypothetical protein